MATIKTGLDTKKNLLRLLEFKSIKTKLTVIIVVMLIVSGTILTGAAALMATGALTESTLNTLDAVGDGNSEKLSLVIETGKNIAATISMEKEVVGLMEQLNAGNDMADEQISVGLHLAEIANALPLSLTAINVYNLDGIIVASSNPSILGRDDSKIDYIVNQQKEAYMAAPVRGTGDVPILPFGRPVYDSGRQQIGLISFGAQYAGVSDTVFSTPGLSEGATSFLVGPDGMILSSVNGDFSPFLTKKFDLSIFSPGETMVQGLGYFGLPAYIGKTPVPGTDYSIITTERVEEVNNPIMGLIMTMVVCLLIVIVAGAFVTIFIAKGFARPIQILKEAATQLALGDVGVAITHTGIDEIGQLADSFRSMIENKKDNAQAVSKIAAGDVAHMINAASDQDVEGHALIQMKKTLASMTASLEALARRSAEGDLSYRAESDQFKGVYRELIDTLNEAFDMIITPVQETMRLSTSYSSGDYSDRFDSSLVIKGDFVPFKAALNQIGINTSDALLKVKTGVDEISEGASTSSASVEEIASAVSTLADSSSRVSTLSDRNDTGLDQALTAMNDLANTVGEVAHRTTAVSELVSQSSDLAHDGVKRAEIAGKGMEEIMAAAEGQAKTIAEMSRQMEEIGGIVGVISGIAEQTSLLALNAAIEAARAGDAGLGFAVVADEVKSLAQESQTSAEHIETIIGNLQKMSVEMTTGMAKASEVVQSGSTAVNETVTIFHQMAESISDVNRNLSEVAAASEEQAASVQEITASMSEVRDMVQDTAREATDSAAAAEEISAALDGFKDTTVQSAQLAGTIAKQVNQFKIE